jgi:DNA helicase-2/ATP-dependent DNA helicase PcrA
VATVDPARLLEDLNDAQRAAVTSTASPLCILAGAGSGKTRVLTRRIGHRVATGDADPRHVLALTFTRKAAGELNTRLRALGLRDTVAAGTFHAVAYAQLRNRWADRGVTPPDLLDRKVGFVARLVRSRAQALDVVGEIEWAKARRIEPDQYVSAAAAADRNPPLDPYQVARFYADYEEAKHRRRMVDFDDLLRLAIRDLTNDPEFAAAQRWRFRHLFVDEFQDVNPLQFDLLRAWLGDRTDLCVVGDPNQAIYAWNGADARYLTHLERWFPSVERVELVDNYRSSPQILAAANAVLAPSRPTSRPLRANRPDGPLPVVTSHPTDTAEAQAIARALRDRHAPGARWSSQAVLVRTNAQALLIAEALQAAGIPHRVRGGTALLDQPEISTALANMRRARGPFHLAVADLAATIRPTVPDGAPGTDDPESAVEAPAGGDESDAAAQRRANLEMLVRLADDYQRIDPVPSVSSFVEWLRTTIGSDEPDRDAVDITTFHAAKGLEWPIVHLAGLERGLVPIGHAKSEAALAEERRLFYVAVTRAERELRCTWAEQRTFGQRTVARQPSPYLDALEHAATLDGSPAPTDWSRLIRAERAKLAAGTGTNRTGGGRRAKAGSDLSPDDQPVFEALKQWRSTKARAANVPAYVIFTDATLEAIARTRPTSKADLLSLPGVGPVKVERHGPDVLAVVAAHGDDSDT